MSLSVSVTWGGEWLVGQRLTPTLLNSIFQNATFDLSGTISAASMPVGGIDYTWRGATWTVGLPTVAPASGDLVTFWDVSGSIHARCTVATLLALGYSAPAPVTSVLPNNEAVVLVSSVEKRIPIRELGKATSLNQMVDTAAVATGVLAATDKVLASKGGTQGTATVEDLTGSVFEGRSTLASASVDLDADFLLLYDTSASAVKKVAPRSLQTGLSAFVTFDGRSSLTTSDYLTLIPGQNLTEDLGADTVTLASGHGITTGEVRQGWWANGCPLTSSPAMAIDTAYWIRATSGTALAFYLTKAAAEADTGRINISGDSGSSAWKFFFWTTDPTLNSGGVIGVNGVVVLGRYTTLDDADYGKYRIFWKSAATLTHPVVTANVLYYLAGDGGVTFASVRASEPTYCDVWSINADDVPVTAQSVHVMMQT